MTIRRATYSDIDTLMSVFANARKIMHSCGNLHQWSESYPGREIVLSDIDGGHCHVLLDNDEIIGTMSLIPGPEPTYSAIDGEWSNDAPYFVIHRMAATVPGRNIAQRLFEWAFGYILSRGCSVIRIDTHMDNVIMKHILEKYGFTMCGIIRLPDDTLRDAYIFTVLKEHGNLK